MIESLILRNYNQAESEKRLRMITKVITHYLAAVFTLLLAGGCSRSIPVKNTVEDTSTMSERLTGQDYHQKIESFRNELIEVVGSWDPDSVEFGSRRYQLPAFAGREDLAVAVQERIRILPDCDASRFPAIDQIVEKAQSTSIVILNEMHDAPQNRDFLEAVGESLLPIGYNILAAETFSTRASEDTTWVAYDHGYYTSEPVFARTLMKLKDKGYLLRSFEVDWSAAEVAGQFTGTLKSQEEVLAATFLTNFEDTIKHHKILLYVGYSHANETTQDSNDVTWLAGIIKARTGIDPLTISVTTCQSSSQEFFVSAIESGAPHKEGVEYDLIVGQPKVEFQDQRPVWRRAGGDLPVSIPDEFRNAGITLLIEARMRGAPEWSVPIEQLVIRAHENYIPLLLPEGEFVLSAFSNDGPYGAPLALSVKREASR